MAVIPRHSTVSGSAPALSKLLVGELAVNTADRAIWTSNGSALVKLSGANRLEQLDDFSNEFANTPQLGNRALIQWNSTQSRWVPSSKIEIGLSANAASDTEIAIGKQVAALAGSIAVGSSSGLNSTVLGLSVTGGSSVQNSVVVGRSITASSANNSVLVGYQATGLANSVSVGQGANATKSGAVVIGKSASGLGISIGEGCSSADSSTAIGGAASGTGAVALGYSAVASAAQAVQLGEGTNTLAGSLKFRDKTIANEVGVQIRTVANAAALNPLQASAQVGTLAYDIAAGELYLRATSGWSVLGATVFDPSTVSFGTLNNVQGVGAKSVDGLGPSKDGYLIRWDSADGNWIASPNVIDCGTF